MDLNNLYLLTYDYDEAFKIKQELERADCLGGDGRVHFDYRGFYIIGLTNAKEKWKLLEPYIRSNNYRLVRGS